MATSWVTEGLTPGRIRLITAGVIITNFLVAVEATVVSTAAPTIVADLGGMALYAWVFTAYMVTTTVTGPIWGKLSDLYGRKLMYVLSVVIFLLGSGLSGQAHSMQELIFWRAVQGLGGGALTPLGQTVLAEIYSLADRARMQAMITTIFGVASILGPLVGGFITQHWDWRWIFYLNVPFGLVGVLILFLTLPPHTASGPVRFDLRGSLLFSLALTLLLIWADGMARWQLSDPRAWGGLLAVVALWALFVLAERTHPDPLLPPELFRLRMFLASALLMTLVGMALYGAITYLPLFYQRVLHWSASQAGQALTPLLVTWILGSTLSTRLILKTGYRITVGIGMVGFTVAFAILATANQQSSGWVLMLAAVLAGVGGGFTVAPLVLGAQSVVERPRLGIATSEILFFRSIGSSVGVTLMGVAVLTTTNLSQGLERAFWVGLAYCLAGLVLLLLIPSGDAASVAARK